MTLLALIGAPLAATLTAATAAQVRVTLRRAGWEQRRTRQIAERTRRDDFAYWVARAEAAAEQRIAE